MAYEPHVWTANEKITTAAMNHIENGIGGITSADIGDASTVGKSVLTATTQAQARSAIGAGTGNGTSNLTIGTTSTTAKAGDYQPSSSNITDATTIGKALLVATDAAAARTAIGAGTSSLAIGTTSSTAKAGNYVPTWSEITSKPSTFTPVTATTSVVGGVKMAATQEDSTATDTAGLVTDFNALLAKLKAAGIMA